MRICRKTRARTQSLVALSAGRADSLCRKVTVTVVAARQPAAGRSQPPTLLLPEQEGINGIRFPIWLDENGKRVAADCPQARQEMINVWPLPLEPRLPASERRAVRLPPASTICPPYGHDAQLPLQLTGVRDGAIIKRLPGAAEATLPLQSSGGAGERWWFLNGEPLTERGRNVTLHLTDKGDYQLLVMDDVGQIATVKFVMQ